MPEELRFVINQIIYWLFFWNGSRVDEPLALIAIEIQAERAP